MTAYTWSGEVDGKSEKATPTGLVLKKGEVISIIADGWIRYDAHRYAAPQGSVPGQLNDTDKSLSTLVAIIGNNQVTVGSGLLHWIVPVDGELSFLFNDRKGEFSDNSGSFNVKVLKETTSIAAGNTTSHEVKGIQSTNTYTYNLSPSKGFGVTTLINTGNSITVNLYAEDSLIYTIDGTGTPNKTHSGICTAGKTGKVKVEILASGKPVKQTKYAFHIFDKEFNPQLAVLAAEDGNDNDFNDAIVILNWPLG